MIWQISVAVMAIAFVILVVYLIRTLRAAEHSLRTSTETLNEMRKTIDELGNEVRITVKQANEITSDLHHKLSQVDPVLESVKNVGEVLSEVTLATKQVSSSLIGRMANPSKGRATSTADNVAPPANSQAGWMKWADIAASVWQKYRNY